jgi:hypothetical protein
VPGAPGVAFETWDGNKLPHFQLEFPVLPNQLEIGTIRRNQPRSVGTRGQRDQHIEVQIAQFSRFESAIAVNFAENLPRLYQFFSVGVKMG